MSAARRRFLLLFGPLLAASLLSCGDPRRADWRQRADAVPRPASGTLDGAARRQFEQHEQELRRAIDKADLVEVVAAFGRLGSVAHAYRLLPSAIASYRQAVELDGQRARWWYLLGVALQESGQGAAAGDALHRVLELEPERFEARLRLAGLLLDMGQIPAAAAALGEATAPTAGWSAAREHLLGRLAAARGDDSAAVQHFEAALSSQPAAGNVRYALAQALRRGGDREGAARQLEIGGQGELEAPDPWLDELDSLPDNVAAHLRRGARALLAGRASDAVGAYRRAVELDPEDAEGRRNLALALQRAGDLPGALAELQQARQLRPQDVWILHDLGAALLAAGQAEESAAVLTEAVGLAPGFVSAHFNRANALMALQRWKEALDALRALLAVAPDHPRGRYLEAMTLAALGGEREARQRLGALGAERPGEALANLGLADLDRRSGDLASSATRYRRATELDPTFVEGWSGLAEVLVADGRYLAAAEAYRRVVALSPETFAARLGAVTSLSRAGRREEALAIAEGALGDFPRSLPAAHLVARLLSTSPSIDSSAAARAVALATQVYQADNDIAHAETLGMAYAAAGDLEAARRWQAGLLAQAQRMTNPALVTRLQQTLETYESGQRVTEPRL